MSQILGGITVEATAERTVAALAAARKADQLYPESHPAHAEACNALVAAMDDATMAGPMSLTVYQGRIYAGAMPLSDETTAAAMLVEAMEARSIECLTFRHGFGPRDARAAAQVLNCRPSAAFDPVAELESRGARHVASSVVARSAETDREKRDRRREADRALYNTTLAKVRELSRQVAACDTPDVRGATDMVGAVLSRLLEDEAAVLGLATIRSQGEQELFHAVNVMIYALALGRQLGLPEAELTELGVAALVHDIGKAQFDQTTPEGIEAARIGHPATGAAALSGMPQGDRTPLLVAYEHHMGVTDEGWPERPGDYRPHPYSRIVAVGNRYDNLIKPFGRDAQAVAPERAVARLMAEGGTALDTVFVRLFIRAIGVVPIGTPVRLSDDSVGVVCAVGADVLTPTVRLVFDSLGEPVDDDGDVDLERDPRFIVEVIDAEALALDPSEHL